MEEKVMKFASAVCITAIALFSLLAIPLRLAAQEQSRTQTFQGKNGRIVWKGFLFADFSTSAILSAEPDGSDVQQLTSPDAGVFDDLPKWSPDGSKIIFERDFPNNGVIDEINADGTGLHEIGECVAAGECIANGSPGYSPNGKEITFLKVLGTDPNNLTSITIWTMNADGTNPRPVTKQKIDRSGDGEPAWSPDGKQIAFTRFSVARNAQALFLIHPDGTGLHRLTKWAINAGGADWSPNGRLITFESYRDCCNGNISQVYTIRTDGSGKMRQLTSIGRNIEPGWSPSGKEIVFAHQPGTGSNQFADIYKMNADGTGIVPIITTDLWESEPEWGTHP
jgi:Tol biopolymer transport system component